MKFLRANAPTFPLSHVQQIAAEAFDLCGTAKPLYGERDQNTLFREDDGGSWILKVANADEDPGVIDCQIEVLRHIQRVDPSIAVPRIRLTNGRQKTVRVNSEDGSAHSVYALSYLEGSVAGNRELEPEMLHRIGATQARLGLAMRGFFHPAAGDRKLLWDVRMAPEYLQFVHMLTDSQQQAISTAVLRRCVDSVLPRLDALRAQVIHGDLHAYNLILDDAADIAGIIDFGDLIHGPLIFDLSGALSDFMTSTSRIPLVLKHMVSGYHAVTPLEPAECALLFDLIELRLIIAMLINAYRRTQTPEEPNYGAEVGFGSLQVVEALQRLNRTGLAAIVDAACGKRPHLLSVPAQSVDDMMVRRKRLLGSRPYVFYDRPIHAVRGEGVWIVDASGRRFLDCYNNVPIVGHCHPHVTEAISRQSRMLNTNTRYLGEQALDYAERLGAKTGGALTACAFVNSGSEANDVAWRMATAWTGARGALTQEFAYHGITEAIDAVSPSARRSGALAAHVRTLLAPDCYRGMYGADTPDPGLRYAEDADRAIQSLAEARFKPAAYFVDSAFMTNGILEPLMAYVAEVFRRVRAAGGLCIADEVQAGFGRMGQHFFGYQHHEVTPDIITVGKPAGNGHPVGVIITRPEILDHFMDKTAFFSTFGGNNVSCAAGLAVLEVLDNEGLIANATAIGSYFKAGLQALMARHDIIGAVRGTGLAIGVELVTDRKSRAPAAKETGRLINRLRDEGILVGSEGVHGNIIKMRPPLVFRAEHVDQAILAFDSSLRAL